MKLQIGMKVLIKDNVKDFHFDAGREKIITGQLPDFGAKRAFALDNDYGIWCIEDFERCVDYPNLPME